MGIRLPLTKNVLSDTGNVGATSVAGGSGYNFVIPSDTDNVVVKFTASISGGGVSATFQTTDDGGTTWYDVARTSIVSNANATNAEWLSVSTFSPGEASAPQSSVIFTGSVVGFNGTIGQAGASTLGSRQISGLPILSQLNRIFFRYTSGVSASSLVQAVVMVNEQAPSA